MGVATKQYAPYDELTTLAHPVISDITSPAENYAPKDALVDDHHTNYPRPTVLHLPEDYGLEGIEFVPNEVDTALRHARVESTRRRDHWAHHRAYREARLPVELEDKIAELVYASAGSVADTGTTYDNKGRPDSQHLSLEERHNLVTSGAIRVECPDIVGRCLLHFVLARGLSDEERRQMDQMLNEPNNETKRQDAHDFLYTAGTRALAYMSGSFAEAWRNRTLPLAISGDIGEFVCGLLIVRSDGSISRNRVKQLRKGLGAAPEIYAAYSP